jgi:phosphopantetheinyl transferase (holo-ACP synthase)
MIYGIGTDIVQLPVLNMRWSEVVSALQKILGEDELRIFSETRA